MSLQHGKSTLELIGVDDPQFMERTSMLDQAIMQRKLQEIYVAEDSFKILLSHRPELFDVYVDHSMDLVLSGHAHGGQFRIPFFGGLVAPNQGFFPKFDSGVYEQDNTKMVLSRGIGNSIIPIRINNPPEIVYIDLIKKADMISNCLFLNNNNL